VSDVVYVGMYDVFQSTNGGTNWKYIAGDCRVVCLAHGDQHALAVDPFDPNSLLLGDDGGVYNLTFMPDFGITTVVSLNSTLGVTQFYHISSSGTDATFLLGATQDNGNPAALGNLKSWTDVGGGDGTSSLVSPGNADVQYLTDNFWNSQAGVGYTTNGWQGTNNIAPPSSIFTEPRYYGPLEADPNSPGSMYLASNFLYHWDSPSMSWTSHLGNQQLSANGWVNAIAVAPSDGSRIYTASNDGQVWMTTDAGTSWREIDSSLPPALSLTSISVNPVNPNDILIGVWRTSNGGHHVWRCQNTLAASPIWTDVSN
jgi:hypothetical protein